MKQIGDFIIILVGAFLLWLAIDDKPEQPDIMDYLVFPQIEYETDVVNVCCPHCESTDIAFDNVDGFECLDCGYWFDVDENGNLLWVHKSRPFFEG